MKKLLLLCLVLLGGVMQASADNITSPMHLNCSKNWADVSTYAFTKSGDKYYIKLSGEGILSTDLYFKLYLDDWGQKYVGPWGSSDVVVGSSSPAISVNTSASNSFKIDADENATAVIIFAEWKNHESYNDNKWQFEIYAIKLTQQTVAFVNNDNWSDVAVYSWANYDWFPENWSLLNGPWPGTQVSPNSSGVYVTTFDAPSSALLLFNDNKKEGAKQIPSNQTLTNNAVYNSSGRVETVNVSAGALGKSTFSSEYPLNFDGITTVKAYRITSASNGVLGLEQVTGSVPAGIGLYIEGNLGASFDVPTCAVTYPTTSMLTPGTGAAVSATESEGTITNFILTNKTTTNASAPLKFYKANGNTVPVGKAYLQIPTTSVGARDSFWFGDETTGIANVDVNANFDANAPMYNLAGQRVSKNYKGVVIQNGKKMLMK